LQLKRGHANCSGTSTKSASFGSLEETLATILCSLFGMHSFFAE